MSPAKRAQDVTTSVSFKESREVTPRYVQPVWGLTQRKLTTSYDRP